MEISQKGIILLKRFEGCKLNSYICPAGILTIGFGHTGKGVSPNQTITQAEADTLLKHDLKRFEDGINAALKVPTTQGQFDALVCFAYNLGLSRALPLVAMMNDGNAEGVPARMMLYTKATVDGVKKELPGLVKRRTAEADLFRHG